MSWSLNFCVARECNEHELPTILLDMENENNLFFKNTPFPIGLPDITQPQHQSALTTLYTFSNMFDVYNNFVTMQSSS